MISRRSILILASASPRRRELLAQIGVAPDRVMASDADEAVLPRERPKAHALRVAQAKAEAVAARAAGDPSLAAAVVLAADTVVACGRRILPKAEDDASVRKCLALLSGRRHDVITAVALIDAERKLRTRAVCTKVAFRRLDPREIEAYARSGEGIGKAGGYAIQGRAAVFVRAINGSYTNVVGLPLTETFHLLRSCGLA